MGVVEIETSRGTIAARPLGASRWELTWRDRLAGDAREIVGIEDGEMYGAAGVFSERDRAEIESMLREVL